MQACPATGRTRSDCGDRGRCSPVAGSCINKSALRGSSAPIQRLAAPHAHGPLAWQAGDATSRASRRPRGTQAVSMVGMSPQPRWRARNASAATASAPLSAMSWDNRSTGGKRQKFPTAQKRLSSEPRQRVLDGIRRALRDNNLIRSSQEARTGALERAIVAATGPRWLTQMLSPRAAVPGRSSRPARCWRQHMWHGQPRRLSLQETFYTRVTRCDELLYRQNASSGGPSTDGTAGRWSPARISRDDGHCCHGLPASDGPGARWRSVL